MKIAIVVLAVFSTLFVATATFGQSRTAQPPLPEFLKPPPSGGLVIDFVNGSAVGPPASLYLEVAMSAANGALDTCKGNNLVLTAEVFGPATGDPSSPHATTLEAILSTAPLRGTPFPDALTAPGALPIMRGHKRVGTVAVFDEQSKPYKSCAKAGVEVVQRRFSELPSR